MKKDVITSAPKACAAATKCVCDKETKKILAEKAKLEKALASANAKAAKAAKTAADKLAKAQTTIAKLRDTVATLKAAKKAK